MTPQEYEEWAQQMREDARRRFDKKPLFKLSVTIPISKVLAFFKNIWRKEST